MYDVLCVGSATVDRFLTVDQPMKNVKLGDKILISNMEFYTGGGGTNSAVALSKLGLKVKLFTKLGNDHESKFIENTLKKYSIKNICSCYSNKKTDVSYIVSSPFDKDRIVYNYKGASQELQFCDCRPQDLKCEWLYLASLVGKSFTTIKKLAKLAHKRNIKILFNPSLYLARKGHKYLKDIISVTEVLVLNKREAQMLLDSPSNDVATLLKKIHFLGPHTVVITCGAHKVHALHHDHLFTLVPPKVTVKHTLGSGDAFTAGLLAGIFKGYSFKDSLRLGTLNATSLIQKVGTKEGLLDKSKALLLLKNSRIKVHVT